MLISNNIGVVSELVLHILKPLFSMILNMKFATILHRSTFTICLAPLCLYMEVLRYRYVLLQTVKAMNNNNNGGFTETDGSTYPYEVLSQPPHLLPGGIDKTKREVRHQFLQATLKCAMLSGYFSNLVIIA